MSPLELGLVVDNTAQRKSKGPKIGIRHGDPQLRSAVASLRHAVKVAHQHACGRPTNRKTYDDQVILDLIACSGELDEPGLHVLHLVIRMIWALNNNVAARRAR